MGSALGSLEGGDGCWWIYGNMCKFILSELKRMWWLAIRNSRNSDAGCPLNFAACELIFCLSVWSSEMFAWSLCYFGYCKNNHPHLRNGVARAHYRKHSIGCIFFSGGYKIIQNQIIVFYFCLAGSSTFVSSDILYIPSVLKALDHQSLGSFVAFRWVFGSNEQHHHRTIAEPKPHRTQSPKWSHEDRGEEKWHDFEERWNWDDLIKLRAFRKTPPFCHQPFPGVFGFGIGHGRHWVIRSWGWDRGQLCWQPVLFFTSFTMKCVFFPLCRPKRLWIAEGCLK